MRIVPLVLVLASATMALAEEKIGFANLELIFTLMPEAQEVTRQLESYQKELAKSLDTKQAYAQQKLAEAQEAAASGIASEEKLSQYEAELKKLEGEIRESAMEADKKLAQKRRELMEPVVAKLQGTIKGVGEAEGYSFVLNSVDGSGTSIVLYGVEERDLTKRILGELGITMPEQK